jgi:hypothetical protein
MFAYTAKLFACTSLFIGGPLIIFNAWFLAEQQINVTLEQKFCERVSQMNQFNSCN